MTSGSGRNLSHLSKPSGLWRKTQKGAGSLLLIMALGACAGGPQQVAKPPAPVQPAPPPPPAVQVEPPPRAESFEAAPDVLDTTVKVALLAPLSGRHAEVGQSLANGAQLALFDLADDEFELIVRDTKGTADGARAAADDVLSQGAKLILGPLFGSAAAAVAPLASARGVSVITFSNDLAVARPDLFVMGVTPAAQVERVTNYAVAQGHRRFAAMAPETEFGRLTLSALQQTLAQRGATLVRVATYNPAVEDLTDQVRQLANYDARVAELNRQRAALRARGDQASQRALARLRGLDTVGDPGFDAIFLPEGGTRLRTLGPLLAFFDVDPKEVQYLGSSLWYDASLGSEPTLQGGWFAAPAPAQWIAFRDRYRRLFGDVPPRVAALGYDSTALAAVLARRASEADQFVVYDSELLAQPSGFSGVDGIFRFLPSGAVQRGLSVLELQRDDFIVRDPAPETFEQLVN